MDKTQKKKERSAIDCFFNSNRELVDKVIKKLRSAKEEIIVMHFWFTWKPIADELIKKHKEGVKIFILTDSRSIEKTMESDSHIYELSALEYLHQNNIGEIKVYFGTLLHHKVIIIDKTILAGSLNLYKKSIKEHEEYLIIVEDHQKLINKFKKEFKSLSIKSVGVEQALRKVESRRKNSNGFLVKIFDLTKNIYSKVIKE